MDKKIAFVGLGNMGAPMAENLVRAGLDLTVYDRVAEAVAKLSAAGAKAAENIGAAVKEAEIVITMLPGDEAVRRVYLGESGVLAHAKTGALLIDCSTINAQTAREVAKAAQERGFRMIDAPVSGGTAGAAAATLTFISGGAAEDIDAARPVLEKMGKKIFRAGESGAGQTAKICNNMLLAVMMIGTSEALNLGAASGLDPKVLSEIMLQSSGRNWVLEVYNPVSGVMENVPAARGYAGGFGTDLMVKDLGIAMETAETTEAATPLGAHALDLYRRHSAAGNGTLDFSSILKLIENQKLAKLG
ncbi:MAG: 3-hydroxyisobutyrate dehydrogenase [Micavibrio sp.]|nr:MAG: 3-hydroxyisobutyrate dehydrogenase [Micavibrio sp.]